MIKRRADDIKSKEVISRVVLGGSALFVWFILVMLDRTDVQPFVEILKLIVNTVVVYHLTMASPRKP